ncbi:unnamed protein product [Rhizophagus irregularis]|uniref:Uncharacterized protein n=1 Tax=Rhizophagus irregularis TaxID=588596 RepID=A0A915YVI4_9GLOM|nr:unnamed protein product [Rhizophagus irregularis]CAB5347143.1 unnamed protein product [Rhizophagus irregularis]
MLLTAIVRCQNYIMEGSCLIMNICVDAPNGDNKVSGLYNGSDICVNAPDSDRKGIRIICLKGYYWSWMFARMLLTAFFRQKSVKEGLAGLWTFVRNP